MDSINNKNNYKKIMNTGNAVYLNNCADTAKVFKSLSELFTNIQSRGQFQEIKQKYQNKVKKIDIGEIEFSIKPSILIDERPYERELEIAIQSLDKNTKYFMVLKRGENKEILDYLNNPNSPTEVEKILKRASDEFSC